MKEKIKNFTISVRVDADRIRKEVEETYKLKMEEVKKKIDLVKSKKEAPFSYHEYTKNDGSFRSITENTKPTLGSDGPFASREELLQQYDKTCPGTQTIVIDQDKLSCTCDTCDENIDRCMYYTRYNYKT